MKTFSLLCATLGTALLTTSAVAGVRIENITRDIASQQPKGPVTTTLVQDGKVRFSQGTDGAMILKNGVMYMLDDKRKTYREMDKATMKASMDKAGEVMKQMQDRMKNMTPEQRAQMEKMMGGNMPGMAGGKEPVYTTKDTGKNDTVEGRKCRTWHLLRDGVVAEELCVVPFNTFPGKEDFQKTFKELAEAFAGLAQAVPGAGNMGKARMTIDGYPVRSRPYDKGKPAGMEIVLKSWTEESVPAASFDVPQGYKKQEMPNFGG
jgi:hypothetical protein